MQYTPNFGPGFTESSIFSFLKENDVYMGLLCEDLEEDNPLPTIVEVSEELMDRAKIEPWQWEVLTSLEAKNEKDEKFCGTCFFNKAQIKFEWKDESKAAVFYGFALFLSKTAGSNEYCLFGKFSQKIELEPPVKKQLSIPANALASYFGRGDFLPSVEDMIKHSSKEAELGCPLTAPKNCKYNGVSEVCALAKDDNKCLKKVKLKGNAFMASGAAVKK